MRAARRREMDSALKSIVEGLKRKGIVRDIEVQSPGEGKEDAEARKSMFFASKGFVAD